MALVHLTRDFQGLRFKSLALESPHRFIIGHAMHVLCDCPWACMHVSGWESAVPCMHAAEAARAHIAKSMRMAHTFKRCIPSSQPSPAYSAMQRRHVFLPFLPQGNAVHADDEANRPHHLTTPHRQARSSPCTCHAAWTCLPCRSFCRTMQCMQMQRRQICLITSPHPTLKHAPHNVRAMQRGRVFLPFLPQDNAVHADAEEAISLISADLGTLLKAPAAEFWAAVQNELSLATCLDSYLRFKRCVGPAPLHTCIHT